jgi:uncharacterized surface protein with fasciclin (FAS1) repeats
MKLPHLLSLAAGAAAFVVPDEQLLGDLAIEDHRDQSTPSFWNRLPSKDDILGNLKDRLKHGKEVTKSTFDDIVADFEHSSERLLAEIDEEALYVNEWLQDAIANGFNFPEPEDGHPHPPHPPRPPHRRPPGKRPHHPPHHGKPNETIYQLISKSKYTTKLAKLIDEYDDLVKLLNSTSTNTTVFAPTDFAFRKIPEDAPKPPKDVIKKVLLYHAAPGLYPAGRVLFDHTVPSAYEEPLLDAPQRIAARPSLRGVTLNFYSHVVAANIPATNGIIHGLDSLLVPPPKAVKIVQLLPGEFSTLALALTKTGLLETLNSTDHAGGTFFAPPNGAFRKLGPKINAFLFSKYGEKYLKALLEYHVVPNQTLYSTAFVNKTTALDFGLAEIQDAMLHHECPYMFGEETAPPPPPPHHPPKKDHGGYFHFDLPTLLEDHTLSADLARYGPFVSFKVNGFVRVIVQDGIAKDGVIQVVSDVLIPPRKLPGPPPAGDDQIAFWNGEELDLEDFKQRLEPYVKHDDAMEAFDGSLEL